MISVLMPCTYYDNYIPQLRNQLKKYYPELRISILTGKSSAREYIEASDILEDDEKIYTYDESGFLKTGIVETVKKLPHFDIIHCLFMERYWGLYASSLYKKADVIYVSVGGSDLYRDSKRIWNRILQRRLICRAGMISSENSQTRSIFNRVHDGVASKSEHRVIRFGVDIIDVIKTTSVSRAEIKRKNGIPEELVTVVCGHNARTEHQHIKMLDAISRLDRSELDRLFLIIPMTYGLRDKAYMAQVEEKVSAITDNYRILKEFMNTNQMAELTMMTDVFIHVQTTDQLSSTMMANMYNGNIIIAGKWLPYGDIKSAGIKFWEVDDCSDITFMLRDIIGNMDAYYDECRDNPDRVYRFSSWEFCSKNWFSAYEAALAGLK